MSFELSSLKAADTAELIVKHPVTGDLTDFKVVVAGPGHKQSIDLKNDAMRRALKRARTGRDEITPEEVERDNVDHLARRIVDWSGLAEGGKAVAFSPDTARTMLADPAYSWLRSQINAFVSDEASFMAPSAKG